MNISIKVDLIQKSGQTSKNNPRIQEIDLTKSIEYLDRIIDNFLNADNLTVLQKVQVESIKFIFVSVLSKAAYHTALEELSRNIFTDKNANTNEERLSAINEYFADLKKDSGKGIAHII